MSFDQAGFNQELQELADKYGMKISHRFIHRFHCDTRRGRKTCSCVGRNEYVLYRQDMEDEENARQARLAIGE